mmetsp:Transcript_28752/g.73184  ORF Transcript_28752/g.73184 Transcript_28752/m.73184 type:complete len:363 (-) Transcript_28752:1571-2659(-)
MPFTYIKRLFGCYQWPGQPSGPYKAADPPSPNLPDAETERKLFVPRTAHKLLSEHFQTLTANQDRLADEFHSLDDLDMMETSDVAEHSANVRKNRYVNVLPFDHNRVRLSGDADYINASLLQSEQGEDPAWCYIAAQGPLASTTSDFWKMVLENKVTRVIMLTRTVENNHIKCAEYFPAEIGETAKYKNYRVSTMEAQRISSDIVQRQLQVKCSTKAQEVHQVLHFHYHLWPDHGVPTSTESIRRLSNLLWDSGKCEPLVVHCSAGIGRTGAFIAIDIIMKRLRAMATLEQPPSEEAIKGAIEVPAVVHSLRRMRRGMVQTMDQYEFIYRAMLEELDRWLVSGPTTTISPSPTIIHANNHTA